LGLNKKFKGEGNMAKRKQKGKELSMRKVREILRLTMVCGMGDREIARSCSVSHATVGKYRSRVLAVGTKYSEIEVMDDSELMSILKIVKKEQEDNRHQPDWEWVYRELRKKSVTMPLLWQEYKEQSPDGYHISQFYKLYAKWKKKLNVSLRQTHKAGEKMFVDYAGQTMPVIDRKSGEIKEAQVFVAVLGASSYTYAEATYDQTVPNWISSHIRAFEYFGGVPEIVVPDNLKSGVSKACRYEPDINTTYHEMALYYGTAIIPARVRKPKDKAKVEAGVQLVERWILAALRNRTFFSLSELNDAISLLLERLNRRAFKKLRGSRLSWFETMEKGTLRSLPQTRYLLAQWKKARVNIDYHVELDRHYYSVPYQIVGEEVDLRYTTTTIEVFYRSRRLASHRRSYKERQHTTCREHMPKSHQMYLEWPPSRIISWAHKVGEATAKVVETILKTRRHPEQGYRSCLGILRMGNRYSDARLEAASRRAVSIGGYSYRSIKSILEKGLDKVPITETTNNAKEVVHENIRGLDYYRQKKNRS
jgi:transposase